MWDNLVVFGSIICVVLLLAVPLLEIWEQRKAAEFVKPLEKGKGGTPFKKFYSSHLRMSRTPYATALDELKKPLEKSKGGGDKKSQKARNQSSAGATSDSAYATALDELKVSRQEVSRWSKLVADIWRKVVSHD